MVQRKTVRGSMYKLYMSIRVSTSYTERRRTHSILCIQVHKDVESRDQHFSKDENNDDPLQQFALIEVSTP